MALPKRRHSISRRNKRRSHDHIALPNLSVCPKCKELCLPHRACPSCGFYKGRLVLPEAAEKSSASGGLRTRSTGK